MKIAIFRFATGLISRHIECPPDQVSVQLEASEDFFLNCQTDATHIIDNEPVTIAPPLPTAAELLTGIRLQRDCLLTSCDWTQTLDAPLTTEQRVAWAAYRQALRDFPEACDPQNPVWPLLPIL